MQSTSTCVQSVCGCLSAFPSGRWVGVELPGLMVTPHFSLQEVAKLFSKVAAPFLGSCQQDSKAPVWFEFKFELNKERVP